MLDNVLAPSIAARDNGAHGRAMELIGRFGLENRIRHLPSQLSSGERQRTALARALLNQPGLLLADEPTGNLDSENSRIVLEHLKQFADDGGAVLLVTHDRNAAEFAESVVEIRDGRLVDVHDGQAANV